MKYFEKDSDIIYESQEDLTDGLFTFDNVGIWHSGMHIHFNNVDRKVIRNPLSGRFVCGNMDQEEKKGYYVLENEIHFSKNKNKDDVIKCYSIISNLALKDGYVELLDKESDISVENVEKLKDAPFFIEVECKTGISGRFDAVDFKSIYYNLGNGIIKEKLEDENTLNKDVRHLYYNNIKYAVPKDTEVYSLNGKLLGLINGRLDIDASSIIQRSSSCETTTEGINIELKDMPSGLFFFSSDLRVNKYGNILLKEEEKNDYVLWTRENTIHSQYPGTGVVLEFNNDRLQDIFNDSNMILLSKITNKKSFEGLMEYDFFQFFSEYAPLYENINNLRAMLQNNKTIMIIANNERKQFFPQNIIVSNSEFAYEVLDTDCVTVIPVIKVRSEVYDYLRKKAPGFFESTRKLWIQRGLKWKKMIKNYFNREYGCVFNCVKVKENGSLVSSQNYQEKNGDGSFIEVSPWMLEKTKYKVSVSSDNVYQIVTHIPDPGNVELYTFSSPEVGSYTNLKQDSNRLQNMPVSPSIGKTKETIVLENLQDVISCIQNKDQCVWFKDKTSGYICVSRNKIQNMSMKVIRNTIQRNEEIAAGKILGSSIKIAGERNFIDYALFFPENIQSKKIQINDILIPAKTECLLQNTIFTEMEHNIMFPPYCKISFVDLPENSEYIKIEQITFKVYVYGSQTTGNPLVFNEKDTNRLWIFNFPVDVKEGSYFELGAGNEYMSKHGAADNEKYKSIIKEYTNKSILPALRSSNALSNTNDIAGNTVYYVDVQISADTLKTILGIADDLIIKKINTENVNVCTYKPLFKKEITYEGTDLPAVYKQHHVSKFEPEDKITYEGKTYVRIFMTEKCYLVEEQTIKQGTTNLVSDLMENCITVNYGKNKITDTQVCPEDSLQCDVQKLKEALKSKVPNEVPGLRSCITEDSNYIYATGRYPEFLEGFLKKVMSYHPLEWDKNLQEKLLDIESCKEYEDFSESSVPDIWADLKEYIGNKNCFYFANPVYFFDRMDDLGLLEHNPYGGSKYSQLYSWPAKFPADIDGNRIVENNPGFAPYAGEGKGINSYEKVNGFFNEWYGSYYHEGVDFAGVNSVTPLHSLITGKVVAMGDQGNEHYGKFLIVEGSDAGDGKKYFFLLGHLNRFADGLKVGHLTYPRMIVGYLGNTGNCWTGGHPVTDEERRQGRGAHLHLSVLVATRLENIYDSSGKAPKDVVAHSVNPFLVIEKRK